MSKRVAATAQNAYVYKQCVKYKMNKNLEAEQTV